MLGLIFLLAACDADCENPARLNGTYAGFHTILNVSGESEDTGDDASKAEGAAAATTTEYDDLSYSVFVNGWSRWDLTWAASSGQIKAKVSDAKERMGDPGEVSGAVSTWSGDLTESEENCNAFEMRLRGEFTTPQGTEHLFAYTADLVWQGDGFAGTFLYSDSYSGAESSGSLGNARGEVIFVAQPSGTFDTGF